MTEIISKPFDWNDNLSEVAQEDFSLIQKSLSYGTSQTIGMALAKLELLEKQGRKVKPTGTISETGYNGETSILHDVNVTISMQVPFNSENHVIADDVKRLLISNGYDVKHVNVQLDIPIGGWENY